MSTTYFDMGRGRQPWVAALPDDVQEVAGGLLHRSLEDIRRVLAESVSTAAITQARDLERFLIASALGGGDDVDVQRPGGTVRYSLEDIRRVLAANPLFVRDGERVVPVCYRTLDGQEHTTFPHNEGCQGHERLSENGRTVLCICRRLFCRAGESPQFQEYDLAAELSRVRGILADPVRREEIQRARVAPVRYRTLDGQDHPTFPHTAGCQLVERVDPGLAVVCCVCRPPFRWEPGAAQCVEIPWGWPQYPAEWHWAVGVVAEGWRLRQTEDDADGEVDYARDLAEAPTFTEALAALEAHKARRAQEQNGEGDTDG